MYENNFFVCLLLMILRQGLTMYTWLGWPGSIQIHLPLPPEVLVRPHPALTTSCFGVVFKLSVIESLNSAPRNELFGLKERHKFCNLLLSVMGFEPRPSLMRDECSTTKPHPWFLKLFLLTRVMQFSIDLLRSI